MIKYADVHQGQRFRQFSGEAAVSLTGLDHPAGMVVRQDQRSCVVRQCAFDFIDRQILSVN